MPGPLEGSIVRFRRADGQPVGCGVLVSQRHVVTCAHVVAAALGRAEAGQHLVGTSVCLDFPLVNPTRSIDARIALCAPPGPDGAGDVAVLELLAEPPEGGEPARLMRARHLWKHDFRALGFPAGRPLGVWAEGVILGAVVGGWVQIEVPRTTGYSVQQAFSGSPIWDERLKAVVGIVVANDRDPDVRTAFAIPAEALCKGCSPAVELALLYRLGEVPPLPPYFRPRPDDLGRVRSALLQSPGARVGVVAASRQVGLQGMPGIGKSVLAADVVLDRQVQNAFPDGAIWLTLGRTPRIVDAQLQVARFFHDDPGTFETIERGRGHLREILADKACLLVLDDVWDVAHARALDAIGSDCGVLITTRDADIVRKLQANSVPLDVLANQDALTLLAESAGQPLEGLPDEARDVARECGNLPLELTAVGATVRGRRHRWRNTLEKLRSADLHRIDPKLPAAIQVSVDALDPGQQQRYIDLAVFPEDTPIPQAVLGTFWEPEGLDKYDAQDLADIFVDRSLARRDEEGRLALHDLQHDYVRKRAGEQPGGLAGLHARLVDAYAKPCKDGWHTGPDDGYYFQHLPEHLVAAGRDEELRTLLWDFNWLQAALEATDPNTLLGHLALGGQDAGLRLVHGTVRLSAHVLARDRAQLPGQLLGRLLSQSAPGIAALLEQAKGYTRASWLRPLAACLTPPGGPLVRVLEGHTGGVLALAVTPDGRRALSGSWDSTVKVWDL